MKITIEFKKWSIKISREKKFIDTKVIRGYMDWFFYNKDWEYKYTIVNVIAFETKKGLIVEIETYRPGLLFGKRGFFIDELTKELSTKLNRPDLQINIKECLLWHQIIYPNLFGK